MEVGAAMKQIMRGSDIAEARMLVGTASVPGLFLMQVYASAPLRETRNEPFCTHKYFSTIPYPFQLTRLCLYVCVVLFKCSSHFYLPEICTWLSVNIILIQRSLLFQLPASMPP